MEDAGLRKFFSFDDADLKANHDGAFTEKQKQALVKENKSINIPTLLFGVLLVFISVLPFLILWLSDAIKFFGWFSLVWLIWTVIWGALGIGLIRGAADSHTYSLRKATGPVKIIKGETYNSSDSSTKANYELRVGKHKFDVEEGLANYMTPGDEFAVYYVKENKKILSVEWISKAKKDK
jgi:hypothetical protein